MRAARLLVASTLALFLTTLHPARSEAVSSAVVREVVISAGLIGAAFALDDVIPPGQPAEDGDRPPGTYVEEPGEVFGAAPFLLGSTAALAVQGATFHQPRSLQTAKELTLAMAGTTAVCWAIKLATQRERPDGSNNYSFPSGHSAVVFSAATVLDRRYGGMVGWAAYGAAAFAAEARVADAHHYFSDVVAGAIIGRLIGRFVTRNP